jgi:hypothetical protein
MTAILSIGGARSDDDLEPCLHKRIDPVGYTGLRADPLFPFGMVRDRRIESLTLWGPENAALVLVKHLA